MHPSFHKKRNLFLSLFFIGFVIFIMVLLLSKEEKNEQTTHFSSHQKEKIKTPCREAYIDSTYKKITPPPQRIEQINKLMGTPIDWVFKDIQGQILDLYCLREKKYVIVHFWATWCAPCIKELPSLAHFAEINKNQIFVVAISTEPFKIITTFLNQVFSDLSPHLKIAQVSPENKSKIFPEDSLPVTYIFNKNGLLQTKELGPRNWSDTQFIKQLTNK